MRWAFESYNDLDTFTENRRNYKPCVLELSLKCNKTSSVKFHKPNVPEVNKIFKLTNSSENISKPL